VTAPVDEPIDEAALAAESQAFEAFNPEVLQRPVQVAKPPGRNEPCYCGSGKKYKLCHGR